MTDKQFVKSVCPTAHLRNTQKSKTVFWYIDTRLKVLTGLKKSQESLLSRAMRGNMQQKDFVWTC